MSKELEIFKIIKFAIEHYCPRQTNNELVLIEKALQRLEAIDNAKPSEALMCFDKIYNTINLNWNNDLLRVGIDVRNRSDCYDGKEMTKCLDTIKQALIKAQKEPKHYLKWEDLQFEDEEQTMKVSLNGSIHRLCYYRNMFSEPLCMIDNTGITIWKENKDFFNDLHLERVEE